MSRSGSVKAMSLGARLAPWMLVLLSNPGALWQPAATTCGVSIRTLALICLLRAVSSRRAPRVCLASALRAYVRVAPARSARTIISVPMLIATKSSFLQLGRSSVVPPLPDGDVAV